MKKSKSKPEPTSGRVPRGLGLTKKSVKVEFVLPERPPSAVYANQMMVQSDGRATYMSFFLMQPPVLFGEKEDVQRKLDELESLKAHMVAQVIVPQDRMSDFLRILNSTFEMQSKMDISGQDTSR
jgi:hypothetical protein